MIIAIIAMLAAILFPVFAQARQKAMQASCLSNMKQLSLAVLSCAQDYDDKLVPYNIYTASTNPADLPGAGDAGVAPNNLTLEPLQMFVSGTYLGMEDFCMQWMDNRDKIQKLYDAQVELARKIYR